MSTAPYRLRAAQPTTEAAAEDLLGPKVRSFYGAAHRQSVWAAMPFVLLLAYVGWLAEQGQLSHWFNSGVSVVAVTMLFAIAAVRIAHASAVGGGELLRLHANGLLDLRGAPRAVRWDEIQSLAAVARPGGGIARHLLVAADGTTLSLGRSIAGVEQLVDEVRARMIEHHAPELRARIAEGDRVRFGSMSAGPEGIRFGRRVVAWDQVREVDADGEEVVVRGPSGERLHAARADEVPNAFLLGELARGRRA